MSRYESERIRDRMAQIRLELDQDVGAVVENAKELTDWRAFVKRHPWFTTCAAAALGYLVVPKRLEVVSPDTATLEALAKKNRLVVKPRADVRRQAGMVHPLVNLIGGALMRSAFSIAGQQLGKIVDSSSAADSSSETATAAK